MTHFIIFFFLFLLFLLVAILPLTTAHHAVDQRIGRNWQVAVTDNAMRSQQPNAVEYSGLAERE